jgi:hypothetical protein
MWEQTGELWHFSVRSGPAERVYLVKESLDGVSTWLEMRRLDVDRWELTDRLTKGQYRFRYYTVEGSVFINGGTTGLRARRLSGEDADVHVEALERELPVS